MVVERAAVIAAIVLAAASAPATVAAERAFNFEIVPPPLAVLAFLGTAALGLLLLAASAYCALRSRALRARRLLTAAVGLGGAYGVALVALGLASEEVTLPVGGEKGFCEIDCHLVYSVDAVAPLGPASGESAGTVWAVTLRTRFDEATISPRRGRERPLTPNPRRAWIEDDAGARHERSPVAESALPVGSEPDVDWDRPLRPGEIYRTRLAFVLPAGRRPRRLLLIDPEWVTRLLLGSETAPWHARVWLRLPEGAG